MISSSPRCVVLPGLLRTRITTAVPSVSGPIRPRYMVRITIHLPRHIQLRCQSSGKSYCSPAEVISYKTSARSTPGITADKSTVMVKGSAHWFLQQPWQNGDSSHGSCGRIPLHPFSLKICCNGKDQNRNGSSLHTTGSAHG